MCGRFVLISDVGKIAGEFAVSDINKTLASTGDIYPGQNCACIIKEEAKNVLANLHWGFSPRWIKQKMQDKLLINARAETLADKPTFRDAFQRRRCLIAADGFYEWSAEKKPFYLYMQNKKPFGLAGIYEPAAADDTLASFVIITTEPNELIAAMHKRMPVIIPAAQRSLWLDNSKYDPGKLLSLLIPYPAAEMAMRPAEFTARRI
jgi:putative SOS response-associated peptidase YedK